MKYRSISDLVTCISRNLHRIPWDIDAVVGIPRSGLLAANVIALLRNIPLADLDGFLAKRALESGNTNRIDPSRHSPESWRRVLVVDDSIGSGKTMRHVREKVAAASPECDLLFGAIYAMKRSHPELDFWFERCSWPRMFEWNLLHHDMLCRSCVDIDGVLCPDPTEMENDGGKRYMRFLSDTPPLVRPTQRIRYLVTSRLEKYRSETEAWLAKWQVPYDELVMLDLPNERDRRRLGNHGAFKAAFYARSNAIFFVESDPKQARLIAEVAGKPVLAFSTQQLFEPNALAPVTLFQEGRYLTKYAHKKLTKVRRLLLRSL